MSSAGMQSCGHNEDGVEAGVEEIFREVLMAPALTLEPQMVTGDHERWDSMANVEILLACEARWGIEFRFAEIDAIRSVGDLVRAIRMARSRR
ncbi:acyl carrier protein [Azohydromonas lata]|uniref:acyl carrier protein n=1 Tax=Azohydromonas lata TaxID=45677 RepID=UPI0012F4D018|nr:acyl carrier protein [Azohydromonas lata]